jgi:preprotein translocase subunit SecA
LSQKFLNFHDELRANAGFKNKIKVAKVLMIKSTSRAKNGYWTIYAEIDTLKDEAYKVSEETLLKIMPEAFAVIKETEKRFVENKEIEVTATPFDREISGERDHVSLEGDKAFWAILGCCW